MSFTDVNPSCHLFFQKPTPPFFSLAVLMLLQATSVVLLKQPANCHFFLIISFNSMNQIAINSSKYALFTIIGNCQHYYGNYVVRNGKDHFTKNVFQYINISVILLSNTDCECYAVVKRTQTEECDSAVSPAVV